jgi:hypothetical protein
MVHVPDKFIERHRATDRACDAACSVMLAGWSDRPSCVTGIV